MHTLFPLSITVLVAVGVLFNGSFYLIAPAVASKSFGLKPPASDPDTYAWLRLKGIRDVASGLVVLALMRFADTHTLGIAFTTYAVIPLGDMLIVLTSGGKKSAAFLIHGLTFAVMLVVGLLLLHAI
jgi:hypothetical protein